MSLRLLMYLDMNQATKTMKDELETRLLKYVRNVTFASSGGPSSKSAKTTGVHSAEIFSLESDAPRKRARRLSLESEAERSNKVMRTGPPNKVDKKSETAPKTALAVSAQNGPGYQLQRETTGKQSRALQRFGLQAYPKNEVLIGYP
ncbi:hypothetical protein AAF712_011734 [Marasmius tenuissimus]|uniref:Uncharacterized protein n=1 Tax=Marasmius tenuissimus TaxID=585030 RepID=A0ABR2ZIF7_9AGAR